MLIYIHQNARTSFSTVSKLRVGYAEIGGLAYINLDTFHSIADAAQINLRNGISACQSESGALCSGLEV